MHLYILAAVKGQRTTYTPISKSSKDTCKTTKLSLSPSLSLCINMNIYVCVCVSKYRSTRITDSYRIALHEILMLYMKTSIIQQDNGHIRTLVPCVSLQPAVCIRTVVSYVPCYDYVYLFGECPLVIRVSQCLVFGNCYITDDLWKTRV